jgi:type IV pilus assembly protein PilF
VNMRMSDRFTRVMQVSILGATCFLLSACVTTVSGAPETEPDDEAAASINFQLAIEYFHNGNYELARDRLILSTEIDPKRPIVWSTLAATYEQLGNLRLAEEAHAEAQRVGSGNFDVQNSYAIFLCGQQRYDDAEKQFERSIRAATNDNPELMMTNAGVCMAQKPDYVKAEAYFRRALERKANYGEALLQMTLLKYQTEDHMGARAFMQRYRSVYPPNAGILYLCVLIETEMGDARARSDCSNELLRDFPDSEESKLILDN